MINLTEILPQDSFDEIDNEPNVSLLDIAFTLLESQCKEFIPNENMYLYIGEEDANFYVEQMMFVPIGDYGSTTRSIWHKCNNNAEIRKILELNEIEIPQSDLF